MCIISGRFLWTHIYISIASALLKLPGKGEISQKLDVKYCLKCLDDFMYTTFFAEGEEI